MHSDDEWHDFAERIANETYLSTREAQVLLVAKEMGVDVDSAHRSRARLVEDVGNRLGVEPSTVDTYIGRVREKQAKCLKTQEVVSDPMGYAREEREVEDDRDDALASIFG